MKRLFLLLLLVLALAACNSSGDNEPTGELVTWSDGQEIHFVVNNTTLFMNVDGLGPNGLSLRGVSGFLQEGDHIRREVGGRVLEFGYVESIDLQNYQANIFLYDHAVEIKN